MPESLGGANEYISFLWNIYLNKFVFSRIFIQNFILNTLLGMKGFEYRSVLLM